MKPKFSITSSSDPEKKECTGHWVFSWGGEGASLKFATGKDAFAVNNLIDAAYGEGKADGRHETIRSVNKAMEDA